METIRKLASYIAGDDSDGDDPSPASSPLPPFVRRFYRTDKDIGSRGPTLGCFMVPTQSGELVTLLVTPSALTVISSQSGTALSVTRPVDGDSYTAVCLTEDAGVAVGAQSGSMSVYSVSTRESLELSGEYHPVAPGYSITCMAGAGRLILAGTSTGCVIKWNPVSLPSSVSVSSSHTVTAVCSVGQVVWAAVDSEGLFIVGESDRMTHNSMITVTELVHCPSQSLVAALSSYSEVLLFSTETHSLVQHYPASLMTCGVPLTSIHAFESVPDSTFLLLGGVDGSVTMRELGRRGADRKLQCVLHRCWERLAGEPQCPITAIHRPPVPGVITDLALIGDASCTVYVIRLGVPVPSVVRRAADEPPVVLDNSV
jgi:hypothetical protein